MKTHLAPEVSLTRKSSARESQVPKASPVSRASTRSVTRRPVTMPPPLTMSARKRKQSSRHEIVGGKGHLWHGTTRDRGPDPRRNRTAGSAGGTRRRGTHQGRGRAPRGRGSEPEGARSAGRNL